MNPAAPNRSVAPPPPDGLRIGAVESILIVRLSALGDVIHGLPALSALKELYPRARIDWVVESLGASVLEGHPELNEVVRLPRKEWSGRVRRPAEWPRILDEVSAVRSRLVGAAYDLIIDFQGNLRSRAVALAGRGGARVGHHRSELKEYSWLLPGVGPPTPSGRVHRVERNLHLVRWLGWSGAAPRGRLPEVPAEAADLERALGDDDERRILLHPFVSPFGRFKEWPGPRYGELARTLGESGHRVLISWTGSELPAARAIVERSGGHGELAPPTPTIRHLLALLRSSDVLVAADTGPLHLAAVSGIPVVALFGPKDPALYGPWTNRREVIHSAVPCSPCTLRKCDHAICMQMIGVDAVVRATERLLDGRGCAKPSPAARG